MAVGLQDGLGQIAEEVVVAVAVRHVGEFRRDPLDERILLIRHPKPHRHAQGFGPLPGLGDRRRTSSSVAESNGSANQTRFWVNSRTT